jgi:pyruvate,water dikinase
MAMGGALASIAADHAAAGTEPTVGGEDIQQFLDVYGHRAPDREIDLGLPRFEENPEYVLGLVRNYLRSSSSAEAIDRFAAGVNEAEAAVDAIASMARRAKGPIRAAILKGLLLRYRELGGLRERPKFDLVRVIALGRRVLREAGALLVDSGQLDEADDVFWVDPTDLRAAATRRSVDLRRLVSDNRRMFDRELARRQVPRLLISDGETLFGPQTDSAHDPNVLVGTAVSPGECEGVVRVLDSPLNAGLSGGEVLVAVNTDPGWTPLFMLAGALIMEVGGVFSHGALVAREYGIPAVVGVTDATSRLQTGQRVRVNGSTGAVTVLDSQGSKSACDEVTTAID